ncbi:MAG: AAA family ATPase, partial [Bacillota bacterium]
EREEVAEGVVLALVARQHVLLLGPPGTAKSALIEFAARQVSGASYFRWLLTKFTTPEELFGPVSLEALQCDSYRRRTDGKLPEAHVAFVDEVFKASSAVLNALLSIMNERVFFNDGEPVRVPLVSLFAASNELPGVDEEAALRALADRFLLRYVVGYLKSPRNKICLLLQEEPEPQPVLSLTDLNRLHEAAGRVAFGKDAAEALVAVVEAVRREGVEVSDRRMKQCAVLLKAKALLEGGDEVLPGRDFAVLQHALWTSPEQRDAVAKAVAKVASPDEAELDELAHAVREVLDAWATGGDTRKKVSAVRRLSAAAERGRKIAAKHAEGTSIRSRAERLVAEIEEHKKLLMEDVLAHL